MLLASLLAFQITVLSDKPPRRLEVTPEHLATAFKDEGAKTLFTRARLARREQDSSLRNYEATVRERVAAGVSIGEFGQERAMFRYENASRVRWQRGVGAYIDLTGVRVGIPVAPERAERESMLDGLASGEYGSVPFYQGQESLWIGQTIGTNQIDDRRVVNPLADGAEAYYTYESGDSITYTLPDGSTVELRELKVRPRAPSWNLAVGSLQFDARTGRVVAAIYRMSAVQDALETMRDAVDDTAKTARRVIGIAKAFAPSITSEFSEVVVEYSLYEGRYWLPRTRAFKGTVGFGPVRMPASVQQAFTYVRVNGPDTLPPIVVDAPEGGFNAPDSLTGVARTKWRDSVQKVRRISDSTFKAQITANVCDSTGRRMRAHYYRRADLKVAVTSPCDIEKLVNSPDFTTSLFAPDDSLFRFGNVEELKNRALGMGAQAAFSLLKPDMNWRYGLRMSRYNRIEGFSTGIGVDQQFGAGIAASELVRFGFSDHEVTGEVSLRRSNLSTTYGLGGYRRLVSASDWGNPFSGGSSMSAFLFGRDHGLYYRTAGGEFTLRRGSALKFDLRLFAERQTEAAQEATFSVGGDFMPNIVASEITSAGGAMRLTRGFGSDPRGLRAFADLRLEGAGGDSSYGRGALELTVSRSIAGKVTGALTLGGGSTVGGVPPQRLWYLGGRETIRGQRPDTAQHGNAFWMTRSEVGLDYRTHRWSVFADVGWVGDRATTSDIGRPMSGAGIGMSMFDGLMRVDFAQGIYPLKKFRIDMSVGARW